MHETALGKTSIEVSEFIFGAGGIGGIGSVPVFRGHGNSAEEGMSLLDRALEIGITVIDTADVYAGGDSERTVGEWLTSRKPQNMLVTTKTGGHGRPEKRGTDLSREHVARQLEQSIGRIGRVDLFLSHGPDPDTPVEETLTAFAAAQEAGQIRAFGMCNVDAPLLERILAVAKRNGLPRPEWIQNSMSLLDRGSERELLPLVMGEGLGFTPFSPLAGGVLSERYLDGAEIAPDSRIGLAGETYYAGRYSEENLAKVAALRELAREREVSVAGIALAWLRAHPAVTAPIVAPSKPAQWQAVTEALRLGLDEETFAQIGAIFE
ncbi:aldo/keto reductase [Sciscionella marina]|uniref:aldo/keto reductase n=1 Tax=Sciscionella marina TaxID=508770 RepID=UPI000381146C|nr:aldo/keto reductase [Sciscionella marina]